MQGSAGPLFGDQDSRLDPPKPRQEISKIPNAVVLKVLQDSSVGGQNLLGIPDYPDYPDRIVILYNPDGMSCLDSPIFRHSRHVPCREATGHDRRTLPRAGEFVLAPSPSTSAAGQPGYHRHCDDMSATRMSVRVAQLAVSLRCAGLRCARQNRVAYAMHTPLALWL
jgi:hypothetical protein